jgi:Zn-dependent membrane protease YugP
MGMSYLILAGAIMLASWASSRLKNLNIILKCIAKRYEVLKLLKMLADNGIRDVRVISVAGQLTDHYNPVNKTVNLSEAVYNQRNAASAAVAAHECGHAVQHAGLSMVNYAF